MSEVLENDLGKRLAEAATGCKLEVLSCAVRRKITTTQRERIANLFDADVKSVDGGRVVLNRKIPEVAEVFRITRAAKALWNSYTIKYEDGVRLIRTDRIQWLSERVQEFQADLHEAKEKLWEAWDDVVLEARERLGSLFVSSDYGFDPRSVIWLVLSFPSVDPDRRLLDVAPEIYEQERQKIAAKLQEAAEVAEQGLREQLSDLVGSLAERLAEGESQDGKKRYVRQAAIDEIVEFANRFKALSVSSSDEVDAIVERARKLAENTSIAAVRKDALVRSEVVQSLAEIRDSLGKFVAVKKDREFE